MLTSNLWQPVGLYNGARGTVYDIGWAPGADPIQDPPCVIMMEFDKYNGPVFLTTPDGIRLSRFSQLRGTSSSEPLSALARSFP